MNSFQFSVLRVEKQPRSCFAWQLYWNHTSAWVNLLHIFRGPFLKNTSGWLLLREPINHTKKIIGTYFQTWNASRNFSEKNCRLHHKHCFGRFQRSPDQVWLCHNKQEKGLLKQASFYWKNTTEDCKIAKYIFLIIYLRSCGCNKFYIKMIFNEITKSKDLK